MAFGVDDAVNLGLGAVETAVGFIKEGKANKEARKLEATRPKLKSSPFIKDQLSLAESELGTGLSADAKTAYEEGIDKSLSTSLNAILKGGGSVNNVGEVFSNSQEGRQRLALLKQNLRLNQINNLVRSQDAAEQERQEMFGFNEWQPWADKAQAVAASRQGAENMIFGGLQTAGSAAMRYSQRNRQESNFEKYFGSGSTGNSGGTSYTPTLFNAPATMETTSEGGLQPRDY